MFAGDIIEGYVSQNGANIGNTDLTLPDQLLAATGLVVSTINRALYAAKQVVVSVVPGNHGETTRTQKVAMRDNFDVFIVQAAQAQFKNGNPDANLTFNYPALEYGEVVFEAGGTNFCLVHGHLFKGQMKGAEKWWDGQITNGRPASKAQVLVAGHFHNFQMSNHTHDRWIIFGPSLETESTWFTNATGSTSRPGIFAFTMENSAPHGGVYSGRVD
jgi:predicted phosphodiesterase